MGNKDAVGSWSTGFCDCCSDCGSCCLTLWCPCVSFGRIAEIVDRGTTSCCAHGTLFYILGGFTHFMSLYACIYRTKLRRLYGIEGNQCADCLGSCLCPHLSICQEYRELQARGFDMSAGWDGNVQMNSRGFTAAPAVQGGMSR
ncbi:protein PLANT CADMIUM RESISTANCE 3-like [Gastrolobium bilobum]|uniref:protein PLANT CADMIUM RESISTANCE 3-like n=1 Tax=Gastrolobium bilobum TaxID=150636 RepID=UPI002AAFDB37|nr:protein PLANT CADMIUM RESISTANCE 3-like [Gastrolobium bilobum]